MNRPKEVRPNFLSVVAHGRRERIAAQIFAVFLTSENRSLDYEGLANDAVVAADTLIRELDK